MDQSQATYYTKSNQLNRYLEQLREEMHRAKRELLEKEAHLAFIKQTANGLQKAYEDIQTVYNLSQNIIRFRKKKQIIKELIQAITQLLPLEAAAFLMYDKALDQFSIVSDYQLNDRFSEYVRKHQNFAYYRWALNEKRPIVLPETFRIQGRGEDEISVILIPVVQRDITIGVVDAFTRKTPEEYTQRDFDLLTILANFTAIAIENSQLYENMELKTEAMTNMKNYLTNVLEYMSNGVLVTDSHGKIQLINKVAENLLNLQGMDPIGNSILEVLPDAAGAKLYEMVKKVLSSNKKATDEIEVETESGKTVPVGIQCNQLLDENNRVKGVIFALQDLTETYELMKLRKIDKLKDQLISNISHELRTPLSAIKSFSEILLNYDEENEETKREFLTIINNESDRLTRLINNILDLSKLESGTAQWSLEPLEVTTIIDNAVDSVQSLLVKKQLKVVKEFPDRQPQVFGDRDKLTQVIVNLLSNAIKFSPDGSTIRITVEIHTRDNKEFVKIGVHDEGPGIPDKYLESIFDKFGQVVQSEDENKPSGTGLGLTISREIINHLGGKIWAESPRGAGASFFVELPVIPENAEDVDNAFHDEPVTVVQNEQECRQKKKRTGEGKHVAKKAKNPDH